MSMASTAETSPVLGSLMGTSADTQRPQRSEVGPSTTADRCVNARWKPSAASSYAWPGGEKSLASGASLSTKKKMVPSARRPSR